MLGEFEYFLITAAAALGDKAYGAAIRGEIEVTTGRRCSIGALYTTIDRLETKGFLRTWDGRSHSAARWPCPAHGPCDVNEVQAAKDFYEGVMRVSQGASWAIDKARSGIRCATCGH